jgi:hypothetical protein
MSFTFERSVLRRVHGGDVKEGADQHALAGEDAAGMGMERAPARKALRMEKGYPERRRDAELDHPSTPSTPEAGSTPGLDKR